MGTKILQALGRNAPYVNVLPSPIIAQRAPATTDTDYAKGQPWIDESVSPAVLYFHIGGGDWNSNELTLDTDGTFASASDSTASSSLAIKTYVDATAIAGAPVATESVAGIGELATDVEAVAGTPSTALKALFVTPSNLTPVFAAPPAIGGTTAAAGTFSDLTADGTGAVSLTGNAASTLTNTAGDLTVDSQAGSLILDSGEAAADGIRIVASNAAGGIDMDSGTGGIAIDSTDAISIDAAAASNFSCSAGDMTIDSAAGSLILSSGENVADSIQITADAGGIDIVCSAGAAGQDIDLINTGGSIHLSATEGVDDAINIDATAGGVDVDAAGPVNIASSNNGASAVTITASAGGVDITATGAAAGEDINITATGSSVNVTSTEDAANSIYLHANGGTSETVKIHSDQGTGVASIEVASDVGGVTVSSGLASADAINITASDVAGGIDIDAGTAGFIVDTTGAISLDAAAASNFTATGAFDITVQSTAGSILLNAGEAAADALNFDAGSGGMDVNVALQMNLDSAQAAADAVRIIASDLAGGIDMDCGTGGFALDTTGTLSLDSAGATNLTATGAFDVTVNSTAGSIILTGAEAAVDAIDINASDAAGGIDIDAGTGGITIDSTGAISIDAAAASNLSCSAGDMTIDSAAGSLILSSGEDVADSIQITADAGGIDITCSAGAAGQDIDLLNTGGSVNITATEAASDAIVIDASDAAGGVQINAGTGSITLGSGVIVPVTARATAGGTYTILNTDYMISTDSTGGAFQVNLPAAPSTGQKFVIYDGAGQAAIGGNVTVSGNGNNIAAAGASAATFVINTAYESLEVIWDGTIWCGRDVV